MSVESLFNNVYNLPSIPKVVQELTESFGSDKANADEIANKIAKDQAFAAKVLRLANSARYGVGRKIASISNAVVLLGISQLRTLVTASGMTSAFVDVPGLDKRQFWKDTFNVASLCKMLGKHAKVDREVAFTCGMMHSIGELLIHMGEPDKASKIDTLVAHGGNRVELQENMLGYHYADVGVELARRWKFPEEIQEAIRGQIKPMEGGFSPYAALIYIATYINECDKHGQSEEEQMAHFPMELAKKLNLDLSKVFDDWTTLKSEEDDIDALLS